MKLAFDRKLANNYKSASQKVRIFSEQWVGESIFCPNCGQIDLNKYKNNQPVKDFYCENCSENYELKSKRDGIGSKIVDGAHRTMMKRLQESDNPNLFLLSYSFKSLAVLDFVVIPKHFFVPEIIEKRRPLAVTARRAGWIGCNILLKGIPESGKIFLVKNRVVESKGKVLAEWRKTLFLREEKEISARGWLLDVMRVIEKLGSKEFALDDVYRFQYDLSKLHPENKHIKDKIRQQLQVLRDKKYLDFTSRGRYKLS